jgi:hypothetical protein
MPNPSPEVAKVQERIAKHLPRLIGKSPDRLVKVAVQRGEAMTAFLFDYGTTTAALCRSATNGDGNSSWTNG